jgi:hypothetical protein
MLLRASLLLFLCHCCVALSQPLKQLDGININEAEFFIFDVTDNRKKTAASVDAYRHQGMLYVALTPLFEGLRVKYALIGNTLTIDFEGKTTEFILQQESDSQGQWFYDGSFYFIQTELIEQLFATTISINTTALNFDLSGHVTPFAYKTLINQRRQRQNNNYLSIAQPEQSNTAERVITVPDQYRLATVPMGYFNLEYEADNTQDNFSGVLQTVSDLAYHSAEITLNRDNEQTGSRIRLSRFPQYTGDKILGIWDEYNFGDLFLRKVNLESGSSRGLGINFVANRSSNQHENMTTSFAKVGIPGWEFDVYFNGSYLESRVVPNDGLMEFNDVELQYGANEFKIVLYGPFGEKETQYERVSVRQNFLSKGASSFGLSFVEQDSSLLDINLSEFNIDDMSANFNLGLYDNWQIGATVSIDNSKDGSESLLLSNQVTLPGWLFGNTMAIREDGFEQNSTLATSFTGLDTFTLQYESGRQQTRDSKDMTNSSILAQYNIRTGFMINNLRYAVNEQSDSRAENLTHRISMNLNYINITNSITYLNVDNKQESLTGDLSFTGRFKNFRLTSSIPYDLKNDKEINPDLIKATFAYNYQDNWNNRHALTVTHSPFFEEDSWAVGYNVSVYAPNYQFTLRTSYNSDDRWQLKAGIVVNFAYDYFNNSMAFSNKTNRHTGTLNVHSYLDRRLNGIPDVLDYDLADVTFRGKKEWEDVKSNADGRARLFGANQGVSALSAKWQTGGTTINNDYLIYSHPGSVQKINLPFYLTTEVEFFVLLKNQDQILTLTNVPIVVSNQSTGDEYRSESDFDGYASFVDLLPGKYHVYIDKQYLADKGFQADIGGFEFDSPLNGGFVVLPNIELSRSESGGVGANKLLNVLLDESNYAPLLDSDNDKLVHLPPKGAMKAAYSSDALNLAKFTRVRMQGTEQERRALREKLANASDSDKPLHFGLMPIKKTAQQDQAEVSEQDARQGGDSAGNISNELDNPVPVTLAVNVDQFTKAQETGSTLAEDLSPQAANVQAQNLVLDLTSGYLVQYSALKSLDIARTLAQGFPANMPLHIVRKLVNGESYYCLVSQVFQDQTSVREYLKTAKKDGFIVNASMYIETIWSR